MFRLKTLHIKDYKNIHKQTFHFPTTSSFEAFIGLNGSGKSNLLEAISLIFKGLLFDKKKIPFEYEITYEIDGTEYFRKSGHAKINGVTSSDSAMRYPSSVIACYSGEDSRLWKSAYEQFYMQYFKNAVSNVSYVPTLMYINKYSWKIAFISLLCSSKESVRKFLRENLGVADISNVTIHIDADASKRETFKDHMACRWYDRIKKLQDEDEKQELNANILASTDMMIYGATKPEDPARVFHFLYLLSMPEKNNPKGQTIDKLIKDISIKLGGIDFDSLSEGEKKMILIECITQVLADNNSLVLLDEPDAHVHISNKKKILDAVEQYGGQIILTTHSPSICKYIKSPGYIINMNHGVPAAINNLFDAAKSLVLEEQLAYLLFSSKHIVITEGKTDCLYIKRALELITTEDYSILKNNTEFISIGGTDAECVVDLLKHIPDIDGRKIIVMVDRDDAGLSCARKLLGNKKLKKVDLASERSLVTIKPNTYVLMLPHTRTDEKDFLIEDYFDNAKLQALTIDEISNKFEATSVFKEFPAVKYDLKEELLPKFARTTATAADMEGFKVLLNKLRDILR